MNQIEATILGQSYKLSCTPGREAQLLEAVAIVDREMSAIRDAGKVKARDRMAVLAALNLAYQRAEPASGAPSAPIRDQDIERLIRRIDDALGDDGHLL
jgi:cell division protein ZapA